MLSDQEIKDISKAFADQKVARLRFEVPGVEIALVEDISNVQAQEVLQFAKRYLEAPRG